MDADIVRQDRSYRRGLVFGFTMAEIVTLVIFALLLALAALVRNEHQKIQEFDRLSELDRKLHPLLAQQKSIDDLITDLQTVDSLRTENQHMKDEIPVLQERIREAELLASKLKTATQSELRTPDDFKDLAAKAALGAKVMETAKEVTGSELRTADDFEDLPTEVALGKRVVQAAKQASGSGGAIDPRVLSMITSRIEKIGNGLDHPPCWVDAGGKIQYIFDTVLTDEGVIFYDNAIPARVEDQKKLPLSKITYERAINEQDFVNQFSPVLKWSRQQQPECRFVIRLFDNTRPDAKEFYKKWRKKIEESFYSLQVDGQRH